MKPLINSLFKVPILYKNTEIDTKPLIQYIASLKEDKSIVRSNIGGKHTPFFNIEDKVLEPLKKEIIKNMDMLYDKIEFENQKLYFQNMWSITNRHKDYNLSHHHPFAMFSGAFYVRAPKNCGNIIFEHPGMSSMHFWHGLKRKKYNYYNSPTWSYEVKEKTLIIFPSWLYHRVEPNMSKKLRTVISFNIGA
jgi:uncharacterized protein (TIGR02466 family)